MFGYCSIVEPCEYCFKFHHDIFVRTTFRSIYVQSTTAVVARKFSGKSEEKKKIFRIRNVWLKQKHRLVIFCAFVDIRNSRKAQRYWLRHIYLINHHKSDRLNSQKIQLSLLFVPYCIYTLLLLTIFFKRRIFAFFCCILRAMNFKRKSWR